MKNKNIIIIILLVSLIPASLPLLQSGFFHFSDEPHIANLYEMIRAIESRQIPPRMAPDMIYGYGYPLFNFYYPLPFYLGSIFFAATGSLILSLKAVFLLTIFLSGVSMYAWLRCHTRKLASFMGALLYIYTPYRAVDLYVRGALGECVAFIFFPLISLLVYKCTEKKNTKTIALLALAVGAFMLSHNLAPMIFLPWVTFYAIVLALLKKNWRSLLPVSTGVALGLSISAYWWFPALIESANLVKETPFNYADHFPFIKQLLLPSWGYGASNPGIGDDISFQIGIANILLVLLSSFVLFKNRTSKMLPLWVFFFVTLFVGVILMNIRTSPIWERFSLANYVQFPWRLLMFTTFITSSFVIFLDTKNKYQRFGLLMLLVPIAITANYFKPSEYFHPTDDYFLKRFFWNRTIEGTRNPPSDEYKNYSEDYLLLPSWTKSRPTAFSEEKFTSENVKIENIKELNAVNFTADISTSEEGSVEIHVIDFPGWEVKVNNEKVAIQRQEPVGNIKIAVPRGRHVVELKWTKTLLRKTIDVISLISLVVCMLLFVINRKLTWLK